MNKSRKKPFLDGETRWGSAHLMVQRILDEKQFILSMLSTDLLKDFSDKFWTMVDRFVYVTKPLYLLTKRIQEETLICGTMYLYRKECCLELEEMEDPLSAQLYEALQKRQHMWFQNPAFLSAIYVDPRLSDFEPPILSTEQKATAVEHLMKTWKHIRTSQGTEEPTEKPSTSASTNVTNLSRVEKLLMTHRQTRPSDSSDMEKRLKRISLDLSLPLNADVLIFWEKRKREDKELSELALTALQTPCTQVSVERSFNGLSQILTKSRMKLGTVPLEQILFIKSNKDLLESSYLPFEVKKEET
nr:uncharacterized protein LOC115266400 [Aedes albopictus]